MDRPTIMPDEPSRGLAPATPGGLPVPALIAAAGDDAARHFLQFFIAHIRNAHTRRAYARQVRIFLEWCAERGVVDVRQIQTEHVAAYVEQLGRRGDLKATSVKQALAAIRMLGSFAGRGEMLPFRRPAPPRAPPRAPRPECGR